MFGFQDSNWNSSPTSSYTSRTPINNSIYIHTFCIHFWEGKNCFYWISGHVSCYMWLYTSRTPINNSIYIHTFCMKFSDQEKIAFIEFQVILHVTSEAKWLGCLLWNLQSKFDQPSFVNLFNIEVVPSRRKKA